MENTFIEVIEKLDHLFDLEPKERISALNQSLRYLHYSQFTEKILFYNLQYSAILGNDDSHNKDLIFHFLQNNRVIIENKDTCDQISLFLFKTLINHKVFLSFSNISNYINYIDNLFNAIGASVISFDQKILGLNLFNHCISCYGMVRCFEIKNIIDAKYGSNLITKTIDAGNILDFVKVESNLKTISPEFFFSVFKADRIINIFLDATVTYYDHNNFFHKNWLLNIVLNNSEKIYSPTFIKFSDKHKVEELNTLFLSEFPDGFLKDLYIEGYRFNYYKLEIDNIKHCSNFKELVRKYYKNSSKMIVKLLSELCFQSKEFNFNYIYLGQLIGNLDINKIQEVLIFLKTSKNKVEINRPFFEHEEEVIKYLIPYFPKKKIVKYLFKENIDFSNFMYFTQRTHKYLDKISIKKERDSVLKKLQQRIDFEVELLKTNGFNLPIKENIEKLKVSDFEIRQPKSNIELITWGKKMNNCLIHEVWAMNVYANQSIILGLFIDDRIFYCIEIIGGKIKQMEGRKRILPDDVLKTELITLLSSKGLLYDKN